MRVCFCVPPLCLHACLYIAVGMGILGGNLLGSHATYSSKWGREERERVKEMSSCCDFILFIYLFFFYLVQKPYEPNENETSDPIGRFYVSLLKSAKSRRSQDV